MSFTQLISKACFCSHVAGAGRRESLCSCRETLTVDFCIEMTPCPRLQCYLLCEPVPPDQSSSQLVLLNTQLSYLRARYRQLTGLGAALTTITHTSLPTTQVGMHGKQERQYIEWEGNICLQMKSTMWNCNLCTQLGKTLKIKIVYQDKYFATWFRIWHFKNDYYHC